MTPADIDILQLIASAGSLVSILVIGAKLVRHAARVELKINTMWDWWLSERDDA